eukprot:8855241-Karenia_brevis.AAC.1
MGHRSDSLAFETGQAFNGMQKLERHPFALQACSLVRSNPGSQDAATLAIWTRTIWIQGWHGMLGS